MTSGLAMKCRLDLAQLARRHRIEPKLSCALPLAPLSPRPILISGIASAATIDQERMRFRPWSLTFLPWRPPALLFRHREPAGEITKIWHDAKGRLLITARVDHPEARRCGGLSIAATIKRYELRDQDDPKAFHALILEADLDEISLTPTPACADCLVTSRLPSNPNNEFFDLGIAGVNKCIEIVEALQVLARTQPEPKVTPRRQPEPKASPRPQPRRRVEPYRQTPFGALVRAIEARSSLHE